MQKEINELYKDWSNGNLPLEVVKTKLIELVYKNLPYFKLKDFNNDLLGNIIVETFLDIERILKSHKPELASFCTYFTQSIIKKQQPTFVKYYKDVTEKVTFSNYFTHDKNHYFNKNNPYEMTNIKDLPAIYAGAKITSQKKRYYKRSDGKETRKKLTPSIKLLIIALKASYYITPDILFHIAQFSDFTLDEIYTMKENLIEKLETRIKNVKEQEEKINREFILKNQYTIELSYEEPGSIRYEKTLQEIKKHEVHWKKLLKNKYDPSYLCPTNESIAKMLNIIPNQVYNILRQFQGPDDSNKLMNIVLSGYENLPSNGQPPQKK